MCKFSDEKDGNYQRVVGVLERWAKDLKEESKIEDDKPVCTFVKLSLPRADLEASLQILRIM